MRAIQRVLNGETEVFSDLVVAFQASVLRMAAAITGDDASAKDIAQDTFVAAFQHLADFDADRATFACWLHAIVRNRSRSHLRRWWNRAQTPLEEMPPLERVCPQDTPEEALQRLEETRRLDAALASLPLSWRRAFTSTLR